MATRKVIITSKKKLQAKYSNHFAAVEKLLKDLVASDAKRDIETQIVYIDDTSSAANAKIKAVSSVTRQSTKKAVDDIYDALKPAYIVLFGAGDVFPFQEIKNPADDDDELVPSDLPYACASPYSTDISSFTGPTRVVGRIPDIQGIVDMNYLKVVFNTIIGYKKVKAEKLFDYFAVTADVWKKSTQQSLNNIFSNSTYLKNCPPTNGTAYKKTDLKPLTHFYNCHGSPMDSKFYGQKGNNYPTAQYSPILDGKITKGTVVAAECCYGAELFNPADEGNQNWSIANMYFKNGTIAFTGSSTIAYGPAAGNGLADLITQYFLKNIINGSSTGSALLEARQKFLSVSGPHLDPYELKTLAQFYLLGDPSIHVTIADDSKSFNDTVDNRRLNLFNKGINLAATISSSKRVKSGLSEKKKINTAPIKDVLAKTGFTGKEQEVLYEIKSKNKQVGAFAKGFGGADKITFRALIQEPKIVNGLSIFDVLILKESGKELLGWKVYSRK